MMMVDRWCACGKKLVRKRLPSTYFETPKQFAKRKYCNQECHYVARRNSSGTESIWWPGESVPFPTMAQSSWNAPQLNQVNA